MGKAPRPAKAGQTIGLRRHAHTQSGLQAASSGDAFNVDQEMDAVMKRFAEKASASILHKPSNKSVCNCC